MMDSVKQDFKIEDEEKQEEQYEKDMKLQVAAKQDKRDKNLSLHFKFSFLLVNFKVDKN